MNRTQFTFYESFYQSIEKLPTNKAKLQAFEIITHYALYGELPMSLDDANPGATLVFSMARPILDRARSRSKEAKENEEKNRQLVSVLSNLGLDKEQV